LILATPLTVCLVVLAKHVAALDFLTVLVSDEPALEESVGFYQRLLALDRAEAAEILEAAQAGEPPLAVVDRVMVPALVHARQDLARGRLRPDEARAVVALAGELVDELEVEEPDSSPPPPRVLGCAAHDAGDDVALRMLGRVLRPTLGEIRGLPAGLLSAEIVARAADAQPRLLVVVALPPGGLAQARYLLKRLRARLPQTKILVGRWGAIPGEPHATLLAAGADHVGITVAETRDQVLALASVVGITAGAESADPAAPHPVTA
jgi:hypothetical protein